MSSIFKNESIPDKSSEQNEHEHYNNVNKTYNGFHEGDLCDKGLESLQQKFKPILNNNCFNISLNNKNSINNFNNINEISINNKFIA